MEGLPFLPGNTFTDPTSTKFHRSQTLGYTNGYSIPLRPEVGIGGRPIKYNQLDEQELEELAHYRPTLTYGQAKQAPPEDFIPAHVAWDKKVLKFHGWFKQTVHESPQEYYRVRHIELYYYLEDDSIAVVEPHVENAGMPQGKLIRRQRLPKNDFGENWHWKDLNNGVNVTFYGRIFHLYDCDKWTKGFLESEGIVVNPAGSAPSDPYIHKRQEAAKLRGYKTKTDFDSLRQFLEMDRKVLRFFCVWDDRDQMFGEIRKFILHYYLVDDTLEVREVHTANDGRDPFPILIRRDKCPKNRFNLKTPDNRYDVDSTFPGVVMELTENEVREYYTPRDFMVGKTVTLYNRRFYVYEMDNFTKAFYWKNFGITDFNSVDVEQKDPPLAKMEIPPFNGFGSLEDSLQSCLHLIPQPPKKDFIKMLENDGRNLRYECVLDSTKPEDQGRRFILFYRLSDDMVQIYEPPVRNSGIIGGKFLERTRIAKPESSPEHPVYYGPQDFYIGAIVTVFKHRFKIVNADKYVLDFAESHADQFPEEVRHSLKEKLGHIQTGGQFSMPRNLQIGPARTFDDGELRELVREVRGQLKKVAITANNRKDRVFLGIDVERQGFISKNNLHEMCLKQHLPADPQIIDRLALEISPENPDRITLEDLRAFLESP